jgi:hypothetical protein
VLFALAGLRRRQITIADLLKMRSGLYNYTDGENSRTQSSPTAFPCPPFSYCLANNPGSYPERSQQPGEVSLSYALPEGFERVGLRLQ